MQYFTNLEDGNEALIKATFFHVALIGFAFIFSHFVDLGDFEMKPVTEPDLITSAVRIDIVAMPKLTLQELKKVDLSQTTVEPEVVKEEVKPVETSKVEFKKEAKKIDVNNLLKGFSQKDVVKKIDKKEKKIDQKALQQIILEGNKVSKGSATTGDSVAEANQAFVAYVQGLPDQVRPNWKLPSYLKESTLRCRVRIFLDANGNIIRTQVFESSGDAEFDAKALEAVKKSSPLPKPGQEFLSRAIGGDVLLGFPL